MTSSGQLEDSKSEVSVSDTRSGPRRVLVLAGGGAKGAYAFGCMLAFARAKIRFKAVAGTSVGALNAILWCSNSMRSGIALWRSISFSSVYPVRFCDPSKYSRTVIRIFAAFYVLCRLAWATWQGTWTPARSLFRAFLAFTIWIPCLPLFLQFPKQHRGDVVWEITTLALWLWLCWALLDGSFKRRMLLLPIVVPPVLSIAWSAPRGLHGTFRALAVAYPTGCLRFSCIDCSFLLSRIPASQILACI
jgi:hypothetical protein